MHLFLVIAEFILAALLIVVVMLQPSKSDGLSGLMIGGTTDTFYSKNKSRTSEARLAKATVVISVLFAVVAILLNIVK